MTDKERLKKIAIAFLTESQSDHKAVRILIKNKQYNLAIYHAQQSVEKLLKACLAAEGKIGIYKHEIFSFFKENIGDRFKKDEMKILAENIPELEEEWSATRYPGWESGEIWMPSEEYTIDDAKDMKKRMEDIVYQVMWDHDFKPIISLKVFSESHFYNALKRGFSFYRHVENEGISA